MKLSDESHWLTTHVYNLIGQKSVDNTYYEKDAKKRFGVNRIFTKFKLLFLLQIILICVLANYSIASNESNEIIENINEINLESDTYYGALKLVVLSNNSEFNTYGATKVEKYDDLYILSYLSENSCQKAYNKFLKDENIISVDVDNVLETENDDSNINESNEKIDTEIKKYLDTKESSKEIKVAILDTGIDTNSKKIKNEIIDLKLNLSNSGEENSIFDDNGHGTEIAEIISNNSNENVKIMPIKIANKNGKSSISKTYLGIKKAIENGANIINISMNTYKTLSSEILTDIINQATQQGIVVVVSAGNDRVDTKYITPANIDSAIVVSAVTNNNILANYSNYGDTIDYSSYGTYNGKSGTSYAAANVTGIISDLLSKDESIELLNKYVIDLGEEGKDNRYGNGFIGFEYNNIEVIDEIPEDNFESTIPDVAENDSEMSISAESTALFAINPCGGKVYVDFGKTQETISGESSVPYQYKASDSDNTIDFKVTGVPNKVETDFSYKVTYNYNYSGGTITTETIDYVRETEYVFYKIHSWRSEKMNKILQLPIMVV